VQTNGWFTPKHPPSDFRENNKTATIVSLIISLITFFAYLVYQVKNMEKDNTITDKCDQNARKQILEGKISLLGFMKPEFEAFRDSFQDNKNSSKKDNDEPLLEKSNTTSGYKNMQSKAETFTILETDNDQAKNLKTRLKKFFKYFFDL